MTFLVVFAGLDWQRIHVMQLGFVMSAYASAYYDRRRWFDLPGCRGWPFLNDMITLLRMGNMIPLDMIFLVPGGARKAPRERGAGQQDARTYNNSDCFNETHE
jgi:hypothetical protein